MFIQAGFSDSVLSGSSYGPPVLSGSKASLPELETSPYHCKSDQILVCLQEAGRRGANSFLPSRLLLAPPRHRSQNKHKTDFWSHPRWGGGGYTQRHYQSHGGVRGEKEGERLLWGLQEPGMLIGKIVLIRPSSLQMLGEASPPVGAHTGGREAHSQILSANNVK